MALTPPPPPQAGRDPEAQDKKLLVSPGEFLQQITVCKASRVFVLKQQSRILTIIFVTHGLLSRTPHAKGLYGSMLGNRSSPLKDWCRF